MRDESTLEPEDLEAPSRGLQFIQSFFLTVFQYRWWIGAFMALAVGAATILGAVAYVRQPVVATAVLPFRPAFSSARAGFYPNGIPYSAADITTPSVLKRTFDRNRLIAFMPFEEFERSVKVVPAGARAAALALDYENRLSDGKLTSVDRTRIEQEYFSRLQTLPVEYNLVFVNPTATYRIPEAAILKALVDILSDWAAEAVEMRGVVLYQSDVIANVFTDDDEKMPDLLRRTDLLRQRILRTLVTISRLTELPGGRTIRGGKDNLSFPELRGRLDDLLRFRVEPLYSSLRRDGLIASTAEATQYLSEQLERVKLDVKVAQQRRAAIEAAFNAYLGEASGRNLAAGRAAADNGAAIGTPQLTDSFIDKLVTLTNRQADVTYRQGVTQRMEVEALAGVLPSREVEFYTSALASMRLPAGKQATPDARKAATDELGAAQQVARHLSEEARGLFVLLSTTNLNPQSQMYSLRSDGVYATVRQLTIGTILYYAVAVAALAMLLGAAACAVLLLWRALMSAPRAGRAA